MNPRSIVLILFAVLFAGGTVYMANSWLSSQRALMTKTEPERKAPEQYVLVAKVNLPTGTLLRADHLRWQAWPETGLAKTYVRRTGKSDGKAQVKAFAGAVVRKGITLGEPVTEARVVKPGERGFLAAVLHPDMRAISVSVSATTATAGFIFPGDRIDLILTHKVGKSRVSETVLTNVRVLAVDQRTNDQATRASLGKTATLEVTPKQVEMINVARVMGRLSLSLRALPRVDEKGVAQANTGTTTAVATNNASGATPTPRTDPENSLGVPANLIGAANKATGIDQAAVPRTGAAATVIEIESLHEQIVPGRGRSVTGAGEVSRALGSGPSVTILRGRSISRTRVRPEKARVQSPGADGSAQSNQSGSDEAGDGEEIAE